MKTTGRTDDSGNPIPPRKILTGSQKAMIAKQKEEKAIKVIAKLRKDGIWV